MDCTMAIKFTIATFAMSGHSDLNRMLDCFILNQTSSFGYILEHISSLDVQL